MNSFNNELVKCLDDLRERREEVHRLLIAEEDEKARVQKQISLLTDNLAKLNDSLLRKQRALEEYDKTIEESSTALNKIMESSQTLLHVLRKERDNLNNNMKTTTTVRKF
ncbi:hypothetical protein BASA81_007559 [Batrachochytrium salamandrivorans]|nr:hypothetical protein BASA81_007559 [Batrachochytrium salamandrivorans]